MRNFWLGNLGEGFWVWDFGWGISGVAFSVRDFEVEILVSGL